MTKTMTINELISKLKEYDGELTVKVWSNGANVAYPISHVFIGSINKEDLVYINIGDRINEEAPVYINIDDRNLVDRSKIWHDVSEQPKPHFPIVYESGDEIKIYECTALPCWGYWSEFASSFGITRWAYVKDLLPKGGEK